LRERAELLQCGDNCATLDGGFHFLTEAKYL